MKDDKTKSLNSKVAEMEEFEGKSFGELVEFAPVFTVIAQKYGTIIAAVYGQIWRRCQGLDDVCYESIPNMAKSLGCSTDAIRRSINKLVEASEIFKLDRIGKTSLMTYKPTLDLESWVKSDTDSTPRLDRGVLDEPLAQTEDTPRLDLHEDRIKKELIINKENKRLLRRELKQHFADGPRRDKRYDDYYHLLKAALDNNLELPEKPRFDVE